MDNPFNQKEWIQIGVALFAGGAFGAVLKILFDTYQNRIQPVSYRIFYDKLFHETLGDSKLKAELQISDGVETRHFQNLYVVRIFLSNTGNANLEEFSFGLTLRGEDLAVHAEAMTPDRHHVITQTSQLALGAASKEIDFVCRPFNRRDTYVLKLFIAVSPGERGVGEIQFSSSMPIRFLNQTVRESMVLSVLSYIGNNLTIGDVFREIDKERDERLRKL